MPKRMSAEQELAIISYYQMPETLTATAIHFCRKNNTIRKILAKHNIPLHAAEVNNMIAKNKLTATCLSRYGETNFQKTAQFKELMAEKYEHNREKTKQTCLLKYGVDNPQKAEAVKEKTKNTNLKRYSVENVFAAPAVKEKIKNTNIARYGVSHISKSKIFTERVNNTKLVRYGRTDVGQFGTCEHEEAMLAKYGARHYNGNTRYQYNGTVFDSFPELAVYIYAIDHSIAIIREPCALEYTFEDKKRRYFPDFEYDGKLLEIKGDQFFTENGTMVNPYDHSEDNCFKAKQKCMLDNNVIVWRPPDYQFALDYFNSKYTKADFRIEKK